MTTRSRIERNNINHFLWHSLALCPMQRECAFGEEPFGSRHPQKSIRDTSEHSRPKRAACPENTDGTFRGVPALRNRPQALCLPVFRHGLPCYGVILRAVALNRNHPVHIIHRRAQNAPYSFAMSRHNLLSLMSMSTVKVGSSYRPSAMRAPISL